VINERFDLEGFSPVLQFLPPVFGLPGGAQLLDLLVDHGDLFVVPGSQPAAQRLHVRGRVSVAQVIHIVVQEDAAVFRPTLDEGARGDLVEPLLAEGEIPIARQVVQQLGVKSLPGYREKAQQVAHRRIWLAVHHVDDQPLFDALLRLGHGQILQLLTQPIEAQLVLDHLECQLQPDRPPRGPFSQAAAERRIQLGYGRELVYCSFEVVLDLFLVELAHLPVLVADVWVVGQILQDLLQAGIGATGKDHDAVLPARYLIEEPGQHGRGLVF